MSKVRVYELARELNLTNKVLMDKLQGLGIAVGSHMSSLDDEAVQRIKAAVFGKKASAVEETRIKPTVIRRRRKVSETVAEPTAEASPEPLPEEVASASAAE
jgi:translation initiation factor IF-2